MAQRGVETITIKLLVCSDVDPVLYQELVRLPKGIRRTNRLRALLAMGLYGQTSPLVPPAKASAKTISSKVQDELIGSLDFDQGP